MNYIITGVTGFIGTHLTNLIKERYPNVQVYNLDIVKPGTPNPVVKDYKPALRDGQKLQSTFIEYDIRKPIENLPFTPTEDDVIFNFAAVHRTPGHEDHEYFETNIRGAENVVAFAEKWNIKKIVFTSSIAPYGAAEVLKKVTGLTQFVPDIPSWIIMPMARTAMLLGSPMGICPVRVKKLQISTNICSEKMKHCGYQFKWNFEDALADWFDDNPRKYLN